MKGKLLCLVLLMALAGSAVAQDPVFSQFYAAPLHVNPAFTGATFAPRITLNYRNQYPGFPNAYITYSAAYEQPIENLNSGFGLLLMTDAAGDGIYKTNRFSATYGYRLQASDEFFIKFGIEAGLIQTILDWDRLVFGDQLDPIYGPVDGSGNPNGTEEVQPEQLNSTVFDVSAGILAYSGPFYLGLSAKHLNMPDESLLQINNNLNRGLPMRLTLHAGAEFNLGGGNNRQNAAFISPNVMFIKQGPFGQLNVGAYTGFGKFYGGLWYRHALSNPDAAIVLLGFRQGVLRIGYSFDLTVSGLADVAGGAGGTHEVSLTINFDDSLELLRKRQANRYNNCFKMFN